MNDEMLDQLRTEYRQEKYNDQWHWETEEYCCEDGFDTALQCYTAFEAFLKTL